MYVYSNNDKGIKLLKLVVKQLEHGDTGKKFMFILEENNNMNENRKILAIRSVET